MKQTAHEKKTQNTRTGAKATAKHYQTGGRKRNPNNEFHSRTTPKSPTSHVQNVPKKNEKPEASHTTLPQFKSEIKRCVTATAKKGNSIE